MHGNNFARRTPRTNTAEFAAYRSVFTSRTYRTAHPVVRVHPETGERGLFIGDFAHQIVGLSTGDSRDILRMLQSHVTRPENVMSHRWSEGELVLMDNRITQHYASDDYGDLPRELHRVTVAGTPRSACTGRPAICWKAMTRGTTRPHPGQPGHLHGTAETQRSAAGGEREISTGRASHTAPTSWTRPTCPWASRST